MPPHIVKNAQFPDSERGEKTIPKFASFKPKQAAPIPTATTSKSYEIGAQRDAGNLPFSRKDPRRQKYSPDRSRPKARHETQAFEIRQNVTRTVDEQSEGWSQSFVTDRTGDPNNLTFGALHRYATSSYSRFGAGSVLGSQTGHKIDRSASSERGLVLSRNEHDQPRNSGRQALWKAARTGAGQLKVRPSCEAQFALALDDDFVSFHSTRRAKRRRGNDNNDLESLSSSDGEDRHYRSVDGKAKPRDSPEDKDLAYASEAPLSSDDEFQNVPRSEGSLARRRGELIRRIDADPSSVDSWLSLIELQDGVLKQSTASKKSSLTNAERRSTAEIKLSMFEKALDHIKGFEDRETLLVGKMDEASKVWDNQKLFSEWQSTLQENPASLTLWKKYLTFRQTNFASFRYDEVLRTYRDCLQLLKRTRTMPSVSHSDIEKLYRAQMYILLRMTLFMRECGFVEQSVSAWQALLEYEFFRPPNLSSPEHNEAGSMHGTTISQFENFWDSEVARVGEDGCKGWAEFDKAGGNPPEPKTEVESVLEGDDNLWGLWVPSERTQSLQARMPARTIDDVVEDDPYRVILFSDIQPFLIDSPSIARRADCINAFLGFCHLPPYKEENFDRKERLWWKEGYLRNELLSPKSGTLGTSSAEFSRMEKFSGGSPERLDDDHNPSSVRKSPFDMAINDYQLSSDTIFAVPHSWFSAINPWCNRSSEDCGPLEKAWVLRSLKQMSATGVGGDDLAEYALALELQLSPETVKKTARGLLKKRPSSLRLYNAYALIEFRLGNASAGENILLTSIKMSKTLDEKVQQSSILLWRTWIWERLATGDMRKAFELMLMYGEDNALTTLPSGSLPDNQSPSSALLLRTERAVVGTRDHLLSLGQHRNAALAIDCLILFTYLRNSSSLSAATSAFKSNCAHITKYTAPSSPTHELLHQSFARLLYHHVTHTKLVKPSDIRSLLAESITLFPENTIFLTLYAWNEARFRIDDRVRSIVKDVVLAESQDLRSKREESVVPHFFAVFSELNRAVALGSNVSTIRSTFERAVNSDSGAHCAAMWKLYLVFEHSRGDMGKARSVFWRAIRACPWVKELYLLAFEYLRGAGGFKDEDLRGIYELMGEKEIRIHVNLEDKFDAMDERKAAGRA